MRCNLLCPRSTLLRFRRGYLPCAVLLAGTVSIISLGPAVLVAEVRRCDLPPTNDNATIQVKLPSAPNATRRCTGTSHMFSVSTGTQTSQQACTALAHSLRRRLATASRLGTSWCGCRTALSMVPVKRKAIGIATNGIQTSESYWIFS